MKRTYCLIAALLFMTFIFTSCGPRGDSIPPIVTGGSSSFILSNEDGGLINQLVAAGYGDYNLYQALVAIQGDTDPSVAEIITDQFLATLNSNPASSAIFTHKLSEYTGPGVAVAISTDGTVQTAASTKYTGAITVSTGMTIQAIATANGASNSSVTSASYVIGTAGSPTFNPGAGTYSAAQSILISSTTTGATIYYTTNGTAPTAASGVYANPITVSASETIEAMAVAPAPNFLTTLKPFSRLLPDVAFKGFTIST